MILRIAIGLWALALSVPLTLLMASHTLPLPLGSTQFSALPAASWRLVHVLATDCPCSASVAEALVARQPAAGASESVILLGAAPTLAARLHRAGFQVAERAPDEVAAETGIQGGPWLVVIRPEGTVAYSGGYAGSRPRPGVAMHDLTILEALRSGRSPEVLPSFGCAASRALRDTFDPTLLFTNLKPPTSLP